jgi:DNA-binding IclR family transcriptional regulator
MGDGAAGGQQALGRAVGILEFLAAHGEATVGEVAAAIGTHRSTATRLMGVLESHDLISRIDDMRTYRLGFGVVRLATAVIDQLDLTRYGRPVCARLAAETGETVNLAVLHGSHALNLDQVAGHTSVTMHTWIGHLMPLHCTSTGKVLLADLPPERRAPLLATTGLPTRTPHTITTEAALDADLRAAEARGYAVATEEYEIGLNAMAAPIRSESGAVAAAASISGPAYRLDEAWMRRTGPTLLDATAEITHLLRAGGGSPG